MQTKGKVIVINPTVQVSEKFAKRDFVIETDETYPQKIQFQLSQDKCNLLDGININSIIEVDFNLRGREWTNPQGEVKYFNTLDAWRITPMQQQQTYAPPAVPTPPQPSQEASQSDDDLPF